MDSTSSWVVYHLLSHEFREFNLVSEEGSRDVNRFTSNNNDSLSAEEFLGNDGSKSSEQMAFTIDNDFLFKHEPLRVIYIKFNIWVFTWFINRDLRYM